MNNIDLACKAKEIAAKKTLYCLGGFGQPLYKANQQKLIKQYAYNKKRKSMIEAKDRSTFAFDCVGLVKAILWGWSAKESAPNGGATYKGNNVPDSSANQMIKLCKDVSTDFNNIRIGEFVWMDGHCGIYVGDNTVIESSPKWLNGVQASGINGNQIDGRERVWTKHGKLPWIDYRDEVAPVQQTKNLDEVALKVYEGKYGNSPQRVERLKKEGYTDADIQIIQKKVNELAKAKTTVPKKDEGIYHTVVVGDNLTKISRKYGTTVLDILKLNPSITNPNVLKVGQKIRVK